MSGAGRKHRAKHMTRQFLDPNAWVGLDEGQSLGVCLEQPRGQHVRVMMLSLTPQDSATTTNASPSSSPSSTPAGAAAALDASGADSDIAVALSSGRMKEHLVLLPGRFRRVIWLSIKDVVVVVAGNVHQKLSPAQLTNFLKDPANAEWKALIEEAQAHAMKSRKGVERAPLYSKSTLTTLSALPTKFKYRRPEPLDVDVLEDMYFTLIIIAMKAFEKDMAEEEAHAEGQVENKTGGDEGESREGGEDDDGCSSETHYSHGWLVSRRDRERRARAAATGAE